MKKLLFSLLITIILSTPAYARLNIVATLPWIGNLANELGKDKVSVKTLIKPSQDPHFVEAKPSMILAARDADIWRVGSCMRVAACVAAEESPRALDKPGASFRSRSDNERMQRKQVDRGRCPGSE